MSELDAYLVEHKHLPIFLRSEENKRALIEFIFDLYNDNGEESNPISIYSKEDIYTYVYDVFFKNIASYGLRIKKINKRCGVNFYDLKDVIDYQKDQTILKMSDKKKTAIIEKRKIVDSKKVEAYKSSLNYMPDFIKDFHDAKDFFKIIHGYHNEDTFKNNPVLEKINFRDGQILMCDYVLWFLAGYGYKIQQANNQVFFKDYCEDHVNDQKLKNKIFILPTKKAL